MNDETRRLYYEAEFKAMGDLSHNGLMNHEEFIRLMMLLGHPGGLEAAKILWDRIKPGGSPMTCEEYIHMMFDKHIHEKTDMWRKLFRKFDHNGDGRAKIEHVEDGLKDLGIDVKDKLKEKLHSMDHNHDGHIKYEDFLKVQLHQL